MLDKLLAACTLSLAALATPTVQAQAWPSKPIRLVVPYSAGGPTDLIARLVARPVGAALHQPVVVENKAGAGGTIGLADVVRSAPDGYSFGLAAPGPLAGMPHLMKMAYSMDDIDYLTVVARIPIGDRRRQGGQGLFAARPDQGRESRTGQAQLRVGRTGNDAAHRLRAAQAAGRDRGHARPVQGCGAGRRCGARRRGPVRDGRPATGAAARAGRPTQGAGRRQRLASAADARRADHRGARPAGRAHGHAVRRRRAQGAASRYSRTCSRRRGQRGRSRRR